MRLENLKGIGEKQESEKAVKKVAGNRLITVPATLLVSYFSLWAGDDI